MKDFSKKIKLIFLPFLIIALSFIAFYTFFHWLVFIKFELFSIKEMFLNFWLPFGLPILPIYFFLRPRLKILKFKDDNKSFGFQFLAVLIIAIPTMIAQQYLITATGKLTHLTTISEFQKFEKTKYYTLKKFYIDKKNTGILKTSEVTGKNNADFNMLIYITMPILESAKDTSNYKCNYWLTEKYSKQISNHFSQSEKQSRYREFDKETEIEFGKANFNDFTYLELIGNTDDHDNFNDAIEDNTQYDLNQPILFESHNEPFEKRNGKKLIWFISTLASGLLIMLVFLFFIKLKTETQKRKIKKNSKLSDIKASLSFLIPKEGFYITPILINLNILVFIIMVFSGFGFISFKTKFLLEYGANYRPYIKDGQFWRLISSIFIHGGIMHLFNNMIGLWFIGLFLERKLGRTKYLLSYLATGIIASLASIWWHEATVSVGASGAIFGLYGLFLALLLFKVYDKNNNKSFLIFTSGYIAINLIMGLLSLGIDNAAHIGGLLSGFLIGFLISDSIEATT